MRIPRLWIACVLKTGGDYTEEYVQKLYRMVARHMSLPFLFLAFTDVTNPAPHPGVLWIQLKTPRPRWWSKLEVFRICTGYVRTIYLDLDTVIAGDLAPLAEEDLGPSGIAMLRGFKRPQRRASGVMAWSGNFRWLLDGVEDAPEYPEGWEQEYIIRRLREQEIEPAVVQDFLPVVSYKHDCRGNRKPPDAPIVCFHGLPRPHEAPETDWAPNEWRAA